MITEITATHCIKEVEELHQFFQDWFSGSLPKTDDAFARFADTLNASFSIVGPDGKITQHADLLKGLHAAHNAGAFKIWIENAVARQLNADLWMVLYEEWQVRNEEQTVRQSTVLFGRNPKTPNGVEWLHVHETWLGGKEYSFDYTDKPA